MKRTASKQILVQYKTKAITKGMIVQIGNLFEFAVYLILRF
jgi:hypothetical protein